MQQMSFACVMILNWWTRPPDIYSGEVYVAALALVIRSFIIACRYGFISAERLRVLRKSHQDTPYIFKDLILFNIITIKPQALDMEIPASIWRNEIEEDDFQFRFLERLEPELHDKLRYHRYYADNGYSKTNSISRQVKTVSEIVEEAKETFALDLRRPYGGKRNGGVV